MPANAKDLDLTAQGLNWTFVGPPKSGKSHLARTAVLWAIKQGKEAKGFIAPRAESVSYAGLDFEYEVLEDPLWDSANKCFTTNISTVFDKQLALWEEGWSTLQQINGEARRVPNGKGGVLVFDTMNRGPSMGVIRKIIREEGNDNFQQLNNRYQPYTSYALRIEPVLSRIDMFRWRTGAHVILNWHQETKEYAPSGISHVEQEKIGSLYKTQTHYKQAMLPEMFGKQAQESVLGISDVAFYTEPVVNSNPYRCQLKVLADGVRQAGARVPILGDLQRMPNGVPNDFGELMKVVTKGGVK